MSDDPTTDRHGLEVIGLDECLQLLASRPYGRIAYLDAVHRRSSRSTISSMVRPS